MSAQAQVEHRPPPAALPTYWNAADRQSFLVDSFTTYRSPSFSQPSSWLYTPDSVNIGNAQKEVVMEVETQLPPSPGRPRSAALSYSPITPDAGTPADHPLSPGSHMRDTFDINGRGGRHAENGSSATALLGASRGMNTEEKLQLGDFSMDDQLEDPLEAHRRRNDPDAHDLANFDPFKHVADMVRSFGPEAPVEEPQLPPVLEESPFTGPPISVDGSDQPKRIQAFAKLEFGDGQFYMNTYAIEIGRDRDAAKKAEKMLYDETCRRITERSRMDISNPDLESVSQSARLEAEMSARASVVSGGIMHIEQEENQGKRRKRRQRSQYSPSKGLSRLNANMQPGQTNYQALAHASLIGAEGPRPVDLTNMVPSPDECPLLPIHPPPNSDGGPSGHKGISRRHVKIAFNQDRGLFEIHVLGRNGCFVDDAYLGQYDVQPLASGTLIQIGGVSLKFVLPNVPDGETGTERTDLRSDAISQSGISYDFEDGMGERDEDDREETPTTDNEDDRYRQLRLEQQAEALLGEEDDDDDLDDEDDADVESEVEEHVPVRKSKKAAKQDAAERAAAAKLPKIKLKLSMKKEDKPAEEPEPPAKRKGPGRPPKNGVMSKREEAELKRKEREAAKAKKFEESKVKQEEVEEMQAPVSPTERRKAGKKKKEEKEKEKEKEKEETEEVEAAPVAEEPVKVIESIENAEPEAPAEQAAPPTPKTAKEKRPPKPPRSPSPVWDESTLTAEQLQKPTASYVILIHEALSNHPDQKLTLPQIYRAIERRYPFFKLRVTTLGWQSSVRHNLSQHPAFVRIQRDGKGWLWGLDHSISIEREKKRRPSPTPMQPPGYGAPGMFNRGYPPNGYMGAMPNGQGQMPQNPYAVWPNNPQAGRGYPPPNSGSRPQYTAGQPVPGVPATYQSPYDASRANQQQSNGTQGANPTPQNPQMPNAYLNQNRPPQPGAASQNAASTAQSSQTTQNAAATSPHPNGQPARPPPTAGGPPGGTPAQKPAFSPPPPPNNSHGIPPTVWAAAERFGTVLLKSMGSIPDAQAIVSQAINRCLGIRPAPGTSFKEYRHEQVVMKPLKNMLQGMKWPVEEKIAFANGQGPPPRTTPGSTTQPAPNNVTRQPPSTPTQTQPAGSVPPPAQNVQQAGQSQQPSVGAQKPSTTPSVAQPSAVTTQSSAAGATVQQTQSQTAAQAHSASPAAGSQPSAVQQVQRQSQPPAQANSSSAAVGSQPPTVQQAQTQAPSQSNTSLHAARPQPSPVQQTATQPPAQTSPSLPAPAQANGPSQSPPTAPANGTVQSNGPQQTPADSATAPEQGVKRPRSSEPDVVAGRPEDGEPAAKREKLEQ